ncbi:hypothetical protein T492DRAFT_464905 [Pavlovales sp. CCMP2436]|nr:hypothetical protein T492DRAFT_464905 [Pavlovales sp. CCMP2436]
MADPLAQLQSQHEAERICAETLDCIVDAASQVLRAHAEEEATLLYSTTRASSEIMSIIDWYALDCDHGEPEYAGGTTWLPDEEPAPAVTDAWSRSALPTRAKEASVATAEPSDSLFVPGGRSAQPQRKLTRRAPSDVSDTANLGRLQDLDGLPPPSQPARRYKSKEPEEVDPWSKKAQQTARKAAVEAAELERVKQIRQETRGKEYSYDRLGRVVVIQVPDGEKLPAYRASPSVGISEPPEVPPPPLPAPPRGPPRASGGSANKQRGVKGGTTPVALALSVAGVPPPYRPSESEQPALMGSLSLAPGVTLKEAGGSKAQVRPRDTVHMSRKEYNSLADGQPARKTGGPGTPADAIARQVQPGTPPSAALAVVSEPMPAPPPTALERMARLSGSFGAGGTPQATQPKSRAKVEQTLGHRARLPRERQMLASKPLGDPKLENSNSNSQAFERTFERTRARAGSAELPDILLMPSQGSVLLNSRVPVCAAFFWLI